MARITQQHLIVKPYFLEVLICPMYFKRHFIRIAKRTINLASIYKTQLWGFTIPLPCIDEQDSIVRLIKATSRLIPPLESILQAAERLKSRLKPDLLTARVMASNRILSGPAVWVDAGESDRAAQKCVTQPRSSKAAFVEANR